MRLTSSNGSTEKNETTLAVSAKQRAELTELRQMNYLNNGVEQDHKNIKRITRLMMRFKPSNSAKKIFEGN